MASTTLDQRQSPLSRDEDLYFQTMAAASITETHRPDFLRQADREFGELDEYSLLHEINLGPNGEHNIKIYIVEKDGPASRPLIEKARELVKVGYSRWLAGQAKAEKIDEDLSKNPLIIAMWNDTIPLASFNMIRRNGGPLPTEQYFATQFGKQVVEFGGYAKSKNPNIPEEIQQAALALAMKGGCTAVAREMDRLKEPLKDARFILTLRRRLLNIFNKCGMGIRQIEDCPLNIDDPEVQFLCERFATYWSHPAYFTEVLIQRFYAVARDYPELNTIFNGESSWTPYELQWLKQSIQDSTTLISVDHTQVPLTKFVEGFEYLLSIRQAYNSDNANDYKIAEKLIEDVLNLYPWIDSPELLQEGTQDIYSNVRRDIEIGQFYPSSVSGCISPTIPEFEAQVDNYILSLYERYGQARALTREVFPHTGIPLDLPEGRAWHNYILLQDKIAQYVDPLELDYMLTNPVLAENILFVSEAVKQAFIREIAKYKTDVIELNRRLNLPEGHPEKIYMKKDLAQSESSTQEKDLETTLKSIRSYEEGIAIARKGLDLLMPLRLIDPNNRTMALLEDNRNLQDTIRGLQDPAKYKGQAKRYIGPKPIERIVVFPHMDQLQTETLSRYLLYWGRERVRIVQQSLGYQEVLVAENDFLRSLAYARIGIAGAGTTGPAVAQAIVSTGTASLGHVIVAEPVKERVEAGNVPRRHWNNILDIGITKQEDILRKLTAVYPDQRVKMLGAIDEDNVKRFVDESDIVFCALDSFRAMHLLHKECLAQRKMLILITDIGPSDVTVDIYDYRMITKLYKGHVPKNVWQLLDLPDTEENRQLILKQISSVRDEFLSGLLKYHAIHGDFPIETKEGIEYAKELGWEVYPQSGAAAAMATGIAEDLLRTILPMLDRDREVGSKKSTKLPGKDRYSMSARRARNGWLQNQMDKMANRKPIVNKIIANLRAKFR